MNLRFLDSKRENKRKQFGYSVVSDILWHSNAENYPLIRFLYNFPVGLVLGFLIYEFGWERLNFLDFHPLGSIILRWGLIVSVGIAFGISPIFRCSLVLVLVGTVGRSGQGILSLYILEALSDGPVANIFHNLELSSNILICHLELESKMATERIALATGPLEGLFEKHFGKESTNGKRMIGMLRGLLIPFREEIAVDTDEDKMLATIIDGSEVLADRENIIQKKPIPKQIHLNETQKPAWTKFKTQLGRNSAHRFQKRCEEIFASALRRCNERFAQIQTNCYNNLPIIGYLVCWQFNSVRICHPSELYGMAEKRCRLGEEMEGKGKPLNTDLDNRMNSLDNISKEIDQQLQMNIHFVGIEEPQTERIRILNEIKSEFGADVRFFKVFKETAAEILSTLLILFVYFIFRDSVASIRKYLNDIEYRNIYLTSYFWWIDEKRRLTGYPFIGRLNNEEIRRNGLQTPFGPPTASECRQSWFPLLRFFFVSLIVLCVLLLDYYLFRVLFNVINFGGFDFTQKGNHNVQIDVLGNGSIAEMLRDLINFNYTERMHQDLSNRVCLVSPRAPDWKWNWSHIGMPLAAMFCLQVVCNFLVGRLILFFVLGGIFRRRSKTRIIHLYNRLIVNRENDRRLGGFRLSVRRRRIVTQKSWLLDERHWLSRLGDRLWRWDRCVFCESRERRFRLFFCVDCGAAFCDVCAETSGQRCYDCVNANK